MTQKATSRVRQCRVTPASSRSCWRNSIYSQHSERTLSAPLQSTNFALHRKPKILPRISLSCSKMRHLPRSLCEFDIDKYLNPFVPSSPIHRFPRPIAHFLGHRSQPRGHICQPLTWWWSFVGAFCSIALIEGVYRSSSALQSLHPPVVIGSYVGHYWWPRGIT